MADISATLAGWSSTTASNLPLTTTSIGAGLSANLQEIQGVVVRGLSHKGSDIASATTTDLAATEGLYHDISGTTTITGFGAGREGLVKVLQFDGVLTLTHGASIVLPGAASILTVAGDVATFVSEGTSVWRCVSYTPVASSTPPGIIAPYAAATAPSGWLACDGSAVSRTTYAGLFAIVSTTWGVGDGSTTFNVPDLNGRNVIGSGTGTTVEAVTASDTNGFTVVANNDKWHTGMTVVLSNLATFTTTATAGPTYYAVRVSSTNVRLATTLALAQAQTPDITLSGTGTATLTHTYTARTLGESGGKESHAQMTTEVSPHVHSGGRGPDAANTTGNDGPTPVGSTGNTGAMVSGGSVAMPVMNPFAVVKYIIKH